MLAVTMPRLHPTLAFVFALGASSVGFASQTLADGVQLEPGEFVVGKQPDSNTVLFAAPQGWVVFDTGRSASHAQRVIEDVRRSGKPAAAIVNSHWHLDHVGGNQPLLAAFGKLPVVASAAIGEARTGFLARYRAQLRALLDKAPPDAPERAGYEHEIELIDAKAATTPTVVVERTAERELGGKTFLVGLTRHAATAGDVWLFDRKTKTLASGDLVTLPAPLLDTACPREWLQSLGELDKLPFDTLVPGHGRPLTHAEFGVYRRAFDHLLACSASDAEKKSCIAGWQADARALVPTSDDALSTQLLDYYLDRVLRDPAARERAGCPAA
jgi:glyoxylase-like metal-dependent hydrolase (beta-lactamase superfamily II)